MKKCSRLIPLSGLPPPGQDHLQAWIYTESTCLSFPVRWAWAVYCQSPSGQWDIGFDNVREDLTYFFGIMHCHTNAQFRHTVHLETYWLTFLARETYLYHLVGSCMALTYSYDLHSGLAYLPSFQALSTVIWNKGDLTPRIMHFCTLFSTWEYNLLGRHHHWWICFYNTCF